MLRAMMVAAVSVLLASPTLAETQASDAPARLRLCTGAKGGAYHQLGARIARQMAGKVEVDVIATQGSWENLEAIDAEPRRCDAIIAQDDAYALYEFEKQDSRLTMDRMTTLYPEHVHLLCNRSVQAEQVQGLHPQHVRVLVNQYGSGTYITWRLSGRLDPTLARFKASEVNLQEGLLKVVDGVGAQCMVIVSAAGKGLAAMANDKFARALKLVSFDTEKLHRKVGRDRRQIYRPVVLPKSVYPNLLTADLKTQVVDAVFFASPEWKARNPKAATALTQVLLELVPTLRPQTAKAPASAP